ncbi:MAG TPA: SHOCT domain-containing protein [Methanomicrobiales archaeon]|nr:SHOCT domain-containing protein [Methanomicrobiales archaeon]
MGKRITKSFVLQGYTETIFDITKNFLPSLNYTLTRMERPTMIVGRRGTTHGSYTSFHVDRWNTVLSIFISSTLEGVKVLWDYDISIPPNGIMTRPDLDFIEEEFSGYRRLLQEQRRMIEREPATMASEKAEKKEPHRSSQAPGYVTELEHLARLRDKGVITPEDFEGKKRQLLNLG